MNQELRLPNDKSLLQADDKKKLDWKYTPEQVFEVGKFELWFQPVYQGSTGEVLHNEVLLRWRDQDSNLYLPDEFMPVLSGAGKLSQVDRLVISKAIECLASNDRLQLSVNLSWSALKDETLISDLQRWLATAMVEARRLSFELTEGAIAQNFWAAQRLISGLKSLGCQVVLDNFASRELTLAQCQQLPVDLIKLDAQCLQSLIEHQAVAKAILEMGQSLGQVTAKFVTDDMTLKLVQEVGFYGFQGNHLRRPSSSPEQMPLVERLTSAKTDRLIAEKQSIWRRLLFGTVFVGISTVAVAISLTSIGHRLGSIVVENGLINGRVVRLRSAMDGRVEELFARSGSSVKAEQVLARIGRFDEEIPYEEQQKLLELRGETASKYNELAAARSSLNFLQNRLENLERQYDRLWDLEVNIHGKEVREQEAALEKAKALERAARLDYDRWLTLYAEGVVPKQQVDRLEAAWEAAEAEVRQAQEQFDSAVAAFAGSKKRVAMNQYPNWGDSFVEETAQLRKQIQNQLILESKLGVEVQNAQERLALAESIYNARNLAASQDIEVKAPFASIIYQTEREKGELVKQSEALLSLLDCNNLWVEVVVSARDAMRINDQKPVRVELAGHPEPLRGEVKLIQAISPYGVEERSKMLEVQALLPTIHPDLIGQPLSRVTIAIPPPPNFEREHKFCGLGQHARLTFTKQSEPLLARLLSWKPD